MRARSPTTARNSMRARRIFWAVRSVVQLAIEFLAKVRQTATSKPSRCYLLLVTGLFGALRPATIGLGMTAGRRPRLSLGHARAAPWRAGISGCADQSIRRDFRCQ